MLRVVFNFNPNSKQETGQGLALINLRGSIVGKPGKTIVLSEFCKIEHIGGSGRVTGVSSGLGAHIAPVAPPCNSCQLSNWAHKYHLVGLKQLCFI